MVCRFWKSPTFLTLAFTLLIESLWIITYHASEVAIHQSDMSQLYITCIIVTCPSD